jgi:Flp pilus assembly CpaF family ATPase
VFNQPSATPAERGRLGKEALTKTYEQTSVKLPETLRVELFHDVLNELIGFGPIQVLLEDSTIREVMVNRYNQVFIEREGKLLDTQVHFDSDEHILHVIERIVSPLGRRVDPESPMVDARLPDGSRVNAVIPPVAIDGPHLTIRKFIKTKLTVLHANSPRDEPSRPETMVLIAGMDLPLKVIRQQVASAIDLIVHHTRLKNGPRKITTISEVSGMEGDTLVMTDIFKYEPTGVTPDGSAIGHFKPMDFRPMFSPSLEAAMYKLSAELYYTAEAEPGIKR